MIDDKRGRERKYATLYTIAEHAVRGGGGEGDEEATRLAGGLKRRIGA